MFYGLDPDAFYPDKQMVDRRWSRSAKRTMVIVSFHTTAEAFAFEKACQSNSIAGRLTTIPRAISAGCGLAWRAPISSRATIEALIEEIDLEFEGIYEI